MYGYDEHSQSIIKSDITAKSFTTDIVFSSIDNVTISWATGVIVLGEGIFKTINAGTTIISGETYIYFDKTDTLKVTTDIYTVQKNGNILIATAKDSVLGKKAIYKVDGTVGLGVLIDKDNIIAGSITANEIAANTITANNILTGTIVASNIAAGTITANEIAANTIVANNIVAGTLTANEINVDDIFAQNITATGTITGATLKTSGLGDRVEINNLGLIAYGGGQQRIEINGTGTGRMQFFDNTGSQQAYASGYTLDGLYPSITIGGGNLLIGYNDDGTIHSGDLHLGTNSSIKFQEGGAAPAELYCTGTALYFKDENGVITQIV